MKTNCESCGLALAPDAVVYVCSYECTICPACSASMREVRPHCGGELVRRPRRAVHTNREEQTSNLVPTSFSRPMVWALSFGVWLFVDLAYTAAIYQLYRSTEMSMKLPVVFALQSSQVYAYALLTPFVFAFANRYPIQRHNLLRRVLLLLAGGLIFTLVHVVLRGLTPYASWDPHLKHWVSAVWDYQAHGFQIQWRMYRMLFFTNLVDDIVTIYLPIVLVAHVTSYYRRFRERELRSSQLQGQLEKARLQALKSQLQPHFLFNTLNSISALMRTDVEAADRMITRLGDLLRTSLETAGTQMTTLNHELDFVNCYIEIEKIRFEERLRVRLDIAPETLDATVPHLLLQPLVDNAIKHGISKLVAGGEIQISARSDDSDLHLEVRDNGRGFRDTGQTPSRGLGLRITRERLETMYGQNHSVEFLSLPDGGCVVRVSIPLHIAAHERSTEVTPLEAR